MNRKTTLILSITGIFVVIVALIGFTYAYYATRVNGNTTEKSVDIVTVNKSIEFADLSETETSETIAPGYENVKIFTVHNTGTGKASYHIYLSEVVNEYTRVDDIKYVLYRKSGNNTITDTENFTDCEIISEGVFPKNNTYIKTDETIGTPNEYYTYALKTTYTNSMYNQDIDQGKSFSSKVQIHSEIENNFTEGTLAYEIINNSLHPTANEQTAGHAKFTVPTPTKVAVEINTETESVVSVANDDDGLSYFFRGNVKNNYVNYGGMCWRIVRIQGDGSIKIVLDDKAQECNSSVTGNWTVGNGNYGYIETIYDGYKYAYVAAYDNSLTDSTNSMFYQISNWWRNNLTDENLAYDTWCLGDIYSVYDENGNLLNKTQEQARYEDIKFYYYNRTRLYGQGVEKYASYMCNESSDYKMSSIVSTLTADEVVYAGLNDDTKNYKNYLNSYYPNNPTAWWTLSISTYYPSSSNTEGIPRDGVFQVSGSGNITTNYVDYYQDFRPAVRLVNAVPYLSGTGTISDPYKIG